MLRATSKIFAEQSIHSAQYRKGKLMFKVRPYKLNKFCYVQPKSRVIHLKSYLPNQTFDEISSNTSNYELTEANLHALQEQEPDWWSQDHPRYKTLSDWSGDSTWTREWKARQRHQFWCIRNGVPLPS